MRTRHVLATFPAVIPTRGSAGQSAPATTGCTRTARTAGNRSTVNVVATLALLSILVVPVHEPLAWTSVPDGVATPVPILGGGERRPAPSDRGTLPVSAEVPSRPVVHVPEPRLIVVERPVATSVRGIASWFCGHGSPCTRGYPGGLYAAAGPSLRVGEWRGRYVDVRSDDGRTVRVQLIDWCACPNGRLIDLYSDAFERLAPLSKGVMTVEVTYL